MMGSSPPSQSTLSDLKVLLELLQAASDPKKAKAVIESIELARKQYDDAIAASSSQALAASEAEKKAEAAALKAEKAEEKLAKQKAALDAQATDVNDQASALAEDKKIFEAYKAEIQAQAKAVATEREQMNVGATTQLKVIADNRFALDKEIVAFDAEVQKVKDLKAEYEAKLSKIRALSA